MKEGMVSMEGRRTGVEKAIQELTSLISKHILKNGDNQTIGNSSTNQQGDSSVSIETPED